MPAFLCLRNLRYGRCLVLLFGYTLGIVLGCAITLTFDFKISRESRGGINVKRELVPLISEENIVNADQINDKKPPSVTHSHLEPLVKNSHKVTDHQLENSLLVAVLPQEDASDSLSMTWGRTVSKTVIFVAKNANIPTPNDKNKKNVQIIKLFDTLQNTHSTTAELFQVLRHLYENFRNEYKWFLITHEKVYVNIYSLHYIVNNAGFRDIIYTGSSDSSDQKITYCSGDAGILLSQAGLWKLVSKLSECEKKKEVIDLSWDAGLGQCINRSLGIGCFKAFSKHFLVDKLRRSQSPDNLWKANSPFHKALTISPVVSAEHMYTLHYFFASSELKKAVERATFLNGLVSDSCQELPQSILEQEIVQNDCSAVIPDDKDTQTKSDSKPETKQQVITHHRFQPTNKFQYQRWQYFDSFYLYSDDTTEPYLSVKVAKFHSLELKRAIQEAVSVVSKRHHPSRMKFKQLRNGYVRHDPVLGNEYIIDAIFADRRKPRKTVNERVRILRPFSSGYVLQQSKNIITEKVHIVVPLSSVTHRCFEFLSMYANVSLMTNQATHLVLVVFGDKDFSQIEEKVNYYKQKFKDSEISIIKGEGSFSRANALHQGMSSLEKSDLAFLCDVDITIDPGFFNRCRRNTVEGKMVYYPEVFKLYNPKFAHSENKRSQISRKSGHWVNYGYGMLCIYKSDYDSVGGLNTKMMGWGGEDVDFFEKVLKTKLEVLQSPDIGLVHRWHPNVCSQNTTTQSNREPCINSRAESLGSKGELAKYIYELMEKHPELF